MAPCVRRKRTTMEGAGQRGHCQPILRVTERHTQIEQGEYPMKHTVMLTIASLLSILLLTLHITDDIVRGISTVSYTHLTLPTIYSV